MKKNTNLLSFNNSACLGCPQIIAARAVINALGPDTIIINATGCLEITTAQHPRTAWGVPWLHSLFANAAPVGSGVLAALKHKKAKTKVLVQGGDGATFDIGFGAVSALWDRGDKIIYVCYDNEIYANTGMQASAATPLGSYTSTTPLGKLTNGHKKDMLAIALAHGLKYVAQTSSAFLDDIKAKVERAAQTDGPSYIQILSPCLPGWKIDLKETVNIARLAAETGLYPGLEFINGRLTAVIKTARPKIKVEAYLKLQRRFAHLSRAEQKPILDELQALADENIKKYGL